MAQILSFTIGAVTLRTSIVPISSLLGESLLYTSSESRPQTRKRSTKSTESTEIMMDVAMVRTMDEGERIKLGDLLVGDHEVILGIGGGRARISWIGPDLLHPTSIGIEYVEGVRASWLFSRLIEPMILLANTGAGIIPVHSSSFNIQGKTVLVTGWTQIGKTEILLRFLKKGSVLISDDWTLIGPRGIIPYPRTIKLSAFNLKNHSDLAEKTMEIEGKHYLDPAWVNKDLQTSDRSTHFIVATPLEVYDQPEYVILATNHLGEGLEITMNQVSIHAERMCSVLAFTLLHYLGGVFSAHLYPTSAATTGSTPPKSLSEYVHEYALKHLASNLKGVKAYQLLFGQHNEPSEIEECIMELVSKEN